MFGIKQTQDIQVTEMSSKSTNHGKQYEGFTIGNSGVDYPLLAPVAGVTVTLHHLVWEM